MAKRFDCEVLWRFSMEVPDSWDEGKAEEAIDWEIPLDGKKIVLKLTGRARMTDEYREDVEPPEIEVVEIEDEEEGEE